MTSRRSWLVSSVSAAVLSLVAPNATAQEPTGAAADEDEEVIETIVVTGIRRSLRDAIDTKRSADALVDAISAEDIGKFPDRNVAESLQRVPGVVTNREFGEGERVSLRGLAPNQTRTLVNGHAVATADWFILDQLTATRNFNFLVLPSDIVGQLQVFKSPTSDLDEGGIGGTVNVITRKPLDLEPFVASLSVEGAYTENSDSLDPQISGVISWANEADTFGILAAGVYQKRDIRRDGIEVLGFGTTEVDDQEVFLPSLIGSALFEQERERIGGNLEIQFKPTDRLDISISGLWTRFNADNINSNFLIGPANAIGNGAEILNPIIEDGTLVAADIVGVSQTAGFGQAFDVIPREAFAESRFIAGDIIYRASEVLTLHAKVGYTDAEGDTSRQNLIEFVGRDDFSFDLRGGIPQVSFNSIDPNEPNDISFSPDGGAFANDVVVENDDDEFFVYLDAEYELDLRAVNSIKVGFKYTDHGRASNFENSLFGAFFLPLSLTGCNGGPCTPADFTPSEGGAFQTTPSDFLSDIAVPGTLTSFFLPTEDLIFDITENSAGFDMRVPFFNEIFSVDEETFAGFIRGDLSGENWRGNVGVRVVTTEQSVTGFAQNLASPDAVTNPFGTFAPVADSRRTTDILPSFNFSYDLTDDLVLRLAAARTLTRPDFTDIAPRITLNTGALTGSSGSVDVEPFRANQFDVSLEYYPTRDSLLALAFFYKDVSNFVTDEIVEQVFSIETGTPDATLCSPTPGAVTGDLFDCVFQINQRSNGGTATVQGVEAIAQFPVAYGFGINANYSFADSDSDDGNPIPGNSRHAFQVGGYYESNRLSGQLSYNWRDDFFIGVVGATPVTQEALGSLDFSLDYRITDQISLSFDAVNLTNELVEQFSVTRTRPFAIFDNGRQFFFGVRFEY